ncbi:MAG: hypothetical protein ACRC1K_07395 [Planctomycetia bacterium]
MTIVERIGSLEPADLMQPLYEAIDHLACNSLSNSDLKALTEVVLRRLGEFQDREEALKFLSDCSTAIETMRGVDVSSLARLIPDCGTGEVLSIINVLANSEDRTYLKLMSDLSDNSNDEISEEAKRGYHELQVRTRQEGFP